MRHVGSVSLLLLLSGCGARTQADNFKSLCDDTITPDPTPPTISQNINSFDTAFVTRYKTLKCCARDYDSIEWFKDDKPLSTEYSTFGISASGQNQTIESTYVQQGDQGNYTCIVRNNLQPVPKTFTINLQTKSVNCTLWKPEISHRPTNQYAQPGESATFFCEAMFGCGDIAKSAQVYWARTDKRLHFVEHVTDGMTVNVQRNNYSIIGSYLNFSKVTEKDYGHYTCHVSNNRPEVYNLNASLIHGVDPNAKVIYTYRTTVIIVCILIAVTTTITTSMIRWNLEMRLFWKDRFGKTEGDDDKEFDVFVCYDEQDSGFALDVLVATLETSYGYKCFAYQRDSLAGDWIPETYTYAVKQSRRFLVVLSQAFAANNWCIYALYIAIQALLNLHSKIICVELQKVSWDVTISNSNIDDTTLRHVLNVIKKIQWEPASTPVSVALEDASLHGMDLYGKGSQTFWKKLRLHLPPRRMLHCAMCHDGEESLISSQASTLLLIENSA